MRKTAPDGDSAGELPEVTTEANSQTTRTSKDSEHSLEDRDASTQRANESEASQAARAAGGAEDASRPPSAAGSEVDESELDFEQAERFAASFRPSWEPDAPATPAPPPAPFVGAKGGAARVIRSTTRGDLTAPKLRKHRGTAYAILGASLLGVGGLLYMAIASSSVHPSAEHARRAENTETRVDAMRTNTQQPAAAEPTPAAAAQPPAAAEGNAQPTAEPNALAANPEPAPAAVPDGQGAVDPNAQAGLEPSAEPAPDPNAPAANPAPAPAAEVAAAPSEPSLPAAEPAPAPTTPTAPPAPPPAAQANAARPTAPPPAPAAQGGVPDIKTPEPAPAAAIPASAAATAPQPTAAEKAKQVVLSLAAHPPTTRLKLDGVPIENPFRGKLPRSSKHRIEARAPGFAPEVHSVRLENDVQLMISLKREPPSNVKSDPYREQRRTTAAAQPNQPRSRGAGFVAENPY